MRTLPHQSGSDNNSSLNVNFGDSGEVDWEQPASKDSDKEKYRLVNKIIRLANDNLSLEEVFEKYNIDFEIKYSGSGWTHICSCPFKEHNDSSPSFGYNPDQDCFSCFGCHKSGRSVNFISYMEERPAIDIAKEILVDKKCLDISTLSKSTNKLDYTKLTETLCGYSDYIRSFRKKYNDNAHARKYVDDAARPLDLYIDKYAVTNKVTIEKIELLVKLIIEKLESFDDE